jgi:hypothetical protein
MQKTTVAPRIRLRTCALLAVIAVTLAASLAGCVTEQPNNEGMSSTVNPVNVTHSHYYAYNGTSYLTGIIKNVGTQNLVDVTLLAEGYANNTTLERGYAGPQTGVNSTLLPGEAAPFMIKMSPIASGTANTTLSNQAQVVLTNSKPATSTRNITSNKSINQTSTQQPEQVLRYKIFPDFKLLNATPYPLAIANNKTIVSNKTISVSGEVYNGGTKNVNSSVAAVAFYGKDGYVLGVFVSRPLGELAPQKTAPFQIDIASSFSISSTNVARTEVFAYKLTS